MKQVITDKQRNKLKSGKSVRPERATSSREVVIVFNVGIYGLFTY